MKTRLLFVALALALTAIAVPSLADHVNEPTAPIAGVQLRVYNYPHAATLLTACDGSEVVIGWNNVRIEPDVVASAKPSEHFDGTVIFDQVLNPGRRETIRHLWDFEWKHSNVPPHTNTEGLRWEAGQGNNYVIEAGKTYQVVFRGEALESGLFFLTACRFTVG